MKTVETSIITLNRSGAADILKAISIFAVVFIHSSFLISFPSSYFIDSFLSLLRFCVPVFIFLWAYFAEKSIDKKENQLVYLAIRFRKLLIPFVFWSTVYFFITADLNGLTITKMITKYWLGFGWSGQYYFIILFQLIPLFAVLHYFRLYFIKFPIIIILSSILFYSIIAYSPLFTISEVIKISDRLFIYWLPYVIIGMIYAIRGIPSELSLPLFIGILTPIFIPIEIYLFHPHIKQHSPYLLPSVFVSSLLLLTSVMSRLRNFELLNSWINNSIMILAQNTLGIFCLNPLVNIILTSVFHLSNYRLNFWGCSMVLPLFSSLFVIIVCLGIIFIFKRMKLNALVEN